MPTYRRPLHSALDPYVNDCVGYDYRLDPDAVHHGLPSPGLTVIIAFGRPLDCGWLDAADASKRWVLVSGLHDRPALIRTHGDQRGLQLDLTPMGAERLLGMPAGALVRTLVDGADLPDAFPTGLHHQLTDADWRDRFDLLEQHLLRRLAATEHHAPGTNAELTAAWTMINSLHGNLRIDDLARSVGWSRRHLLTRFRTAYGFGPKVVARLTRFQHAKSLAESGLGLAAAAHCAGYTDQAHLTREWRSFAGVSPRHTLAEFPSVQEPLPWPAPD